MKASEIRALSIQEIKEKIEAERQSLAVAKMDHVVTPAEDTSQLRKSRRNIARLLTILAEKQNQ